MPAEYDSDPGNVCRTISATLLCKMQREKAKHNYLFLGYARLGHKQAFRIHVVTGVRCHTCQILSFATSDQCPAHRFPNIPCGKIICRCSGNAWQFASDDAFSIQIDSLGGIDKCPMSVCGRCTIGVTDASSWRRSFYLRRK
jgi:hypothetical protein